MHVTFSQTLLILVPSPILNAQSTRLIFLDFLSVFKLLLSFYDMYLMFCTIAIFGVFVCYRILFFKGHRKSLFEPGVSYSTSMSLVCIATSLIFEQIK